MGTWGPGIFSDDVALDTRNAWREALMDGLDDASATKHVLDELGVVFDDESEALVAWLALAAAQHETGRLQPLVRERALTIIDAGGDLPTWRHESIEFVRAREEALAALAEKLRGPQPGAEDAQAAEAVCLSASSGRCRTHSRRAGGGPTCGSWDRPNAGRH
jgi:hypothetical protein